MILSASSVIVAFSDFLCGFPLFILLIGGGLFLFIYSGAVPVRHFVTALRSLETEKSGEGQISSFQALMSTISSTVGLGNIAGVAIAIVVGGPGSIFWMWVSAILGMATKFFEGTLAIMYKGRDSHGEVQGGPMYVITEGISPRLKPLACFFATAGMIGCLVLMQANQLAEAISEIFVQPVFGVEDGFMVRLIIGLVVGGIVSYVVLGGIKRISNLATKIVPFMVACYFLLVFTIMVLYFDRIPGVFAAIFSGAFSAKAGFGALVATALTGARRAMYVNEAGVGTASLMHGASRNAEPCREGLVAMLGPFIDSGFVCTLTAIPIIMAGNYHVEGVKGLTIALGSFDILLPVAGKYLLMAMVVIFAFSTMFSYSYNGTKCAAYLFGDTGAKFYRYFYLLLIVVASIISLDVAVSIMDAAFALMAIPTMFSLLYLAPRAKAEMKQYFNKKQ